MRATPATLSPLTHASPRCAPQEGTPVAIPSATLLAYAPLVESAASVLICGVSFQDTDLNYTVATYLPNLAAIQGPCLVCEPSKPLNPRHRTGWAARALGCCPPRACVHVCVCVCAASAFARVAGGPGGCVERCSRRWLPLTRAWRLALPLVAGDITVKYNENMAEFVLPATVRARNLFIGHPPRAWAAPALML